MHIIIFEMIHYLHLLIMILLQTLVFQHALVFSFTYVVNT